WRTGHDAAPDTEEDPETVGEAGLDLVGSERIFQASGLDTGDQGEERADRYVWAVLDVVLQHVRRIPRLDHAVEQFLPALPVHVVEERCRLFHHDQGVWVLLQRLDDAGATSEVPDHHVR